MDIDGNCTLKPMTSRQCVKRIIRMMTSHRASMFRLDQKAENLFA